MNKTEKCMRLIGSYFLIFGIICCHLVSLNFHFPFGLNPNIIGYIIVVLMCTPRLICNKRWASMMLFTWAVLTTLMLMFYAGFVILLIGVYGLGPRDMILVSIIALVTLLNCFLCLKIYKLLFKTKESVLNNQQNDNSGISPTVKTEGKNNEE